MQLTLLRSALIRVQKPYFCEESHVWPKNCMTIYVTTHTKKVRIQIQINDRNNRNVSLWSTVGVLDRSINHSAIRPLWSPILQLLLFLQQTLFQINSKVEHKPPLTRLTHIGIETEKEKWENCQNFSKCKKLLFGVKILHTRLDSKITLYSASKLNAINHNTDAS